MVAAMPAEVRSDDILDVVRLLPDVLFRCYKGDDGRIYWRLNEGGLAEEFGLTTKEIEGKGLDELFPGGASDELHQHFEEAFRGESTIFTNQIGDRHFRHFPKAVRDENGDVVEVVGYIADVTDLIHAQEDLARANKELDAFVHATSHDLKNPLTVISTLGQLLQEDHADELSPTAQGHLERMQRTIARMRSMVDDFLHLSRARSQPLHRTDVELSAVARSVADDLQAAEPERDVTWDIQDALHARADAALMRSVLENLMGNAWKYTADGAATISFSQETTEAGDAFAVRDDGPGFDADAATELFQPFVRGHMGSIEGTGIGLSTVERIIDRHGGRVWAESSPGTGAAFFFTLP